MESINRHEPQSDSLFGVMLMLLCAVCLCMGQFIWKQYSGLISIVAGFLIYGLGALAMLTAYKFGSLSVLQPINSVSYIISAVLGAVFFQETITLGRILGIAVIMIGVVVLAGGEHPA